MTSLEKIVNAEKEEVTQNVELESTPLEFLHAAAGLVMEEIKMESMLIREEDKNAVSVAGSKKVKKKKILIRLIKKF